MNKWLLGVLLGALVVSNAYWLLESLDSGVGSTYLGQSLEDECHALNQALALLPGLAEGKSRSRVLKVARRGTAGESFDKDGATWIGRLGLFFDESEALVRVERDWRPSACQ